MTLLVLTAGLLGACSGSEPSPARRNVASADLSAGRERAGAVSRAVQRWADAPTLETARASAEEARNLVTGSGPLGAGDLDEDGEARRADEPGLLPGTDGEPGIASALADCLQVERDVLGGSWAQPADRWETLADAIANWSPADNTFPALPSHPQRIVGWATLALGTNSLAEAHEYAGHARLHVYVTEDALDSCG